MGLFDGEPSAADLAQRFGLRHASIETIGDFHRIYCNLSIPDRDASVADLFQRIDLEAGLGESRTDALYRHLLDCMREQIGAASACPPAPDAAVRAAASGNNAFIFRDRNAFWADQIDAASKAPGVPMYMLGVGHFTLGSPDLFTLLLAKGFSLSLIRSLDDLPAAVSRRPLAEAVRPASN